MISAATFAELAGYAARGRIGTAVTLRCDNPNPEAGSTVVIDWSSDEAGQMMIGSRGPFSVPTRGRHRVNVDAEPVLIHLTCGRESAEVLIRPIVETTAARDKYSFGFWVFVLVIVSSIGYPLINAFYRTGAVETSQAISSLAKTTAKGPAEAAPVAPRQPLVVSNSAQSVVTNRPVKDVPSTGKTVSVRASSSATTANAELWSDPRGYASRRNSNPSQ
ncbi:hypothetical protein [Propionivibrio dicarboxylicus]|uniref:Uncharacterized protein n=1 Tax=Propionivibrio dicarboxylicus TaxID=83767 RepID=A0A1G8NWA7_9RHOO|nr:hypothetical protein [Propionivibrio dicarboxylicus]SDI84509.1 hypothetical protein SAMN05660652_04123 [Propionivibrio dicarboxylicus]